MNTKKIDDQIRDYYASQRPSPDTVARLKQMVGSGAPLRSRRRFWIASAAALAIALTTLIWTAAHHVAESPQQVAAAVARQAALGHNDRRELEFRVATCAELQRQMKSLDFTLVEPAMMREMNMRIVGARYATLAGEIAAQILYIDPHGVPCTLYETRPANQLAGVATGDHLIDGLRVSVWKEKGLVMVLARPMAQIKMIEREHASSELANAYETMAGERGTVSNILKVHSVSPSTMLAHLGLYNQLMFGRSELTRGLQQRLDH